MNASERPPLPCPTCQYDLRAATRTPDRRIQCPECGTSWKPGELRRIVTADESLGERTWLLTTLGPAIALPALITIFFMFDNPLAYIAPMFIITCYAFSHSALTTPVQSHRSLHVLLRGVIFLAMIILLAIPAAIVVVPFTLLVKSMIENLF